MKKKKKNASYLAIEFRYWTRVLRWLGRRGQRWTSRRWKLVRILRASTWPVILGRVARFPIATFWRPIIAHRPSHFGLVRHTVARIQPSCRRQRDFWCWTAKIYPRNWVEQGDRRGDSFVSLPKFQPLETVNESRYQSVALSRNSFVTRFFVSSHTFASYTRHVSFQDYYY